MITARKTIGFAQGADRQKNARRRVKLAAGGTFDSRRMSRAIVPHFGRRREWVLVAILVGGMSGILPAIALNALGALFDVIGWWPALAGVAACFAAFVRWVWSL